MIMVLPSFTATYEMPAVLFTGPIERSDAEPHPLDDVHHRQMLLHCNGAIFPNLDQSPPALPRPFHQSLLLPPSKGEVLPAKRVYHERDSHSQESLP